MRRLDILLTLHLLTAATAFATLDPRAISGPGRIHLGTAEDFVILAKSGVSSIPTTSITGNIGVTPIAGTAITGLPIFHVAGAPFATSSSVNGLIYSADYGAPTPAYLGKALLDAQAAHLEAASRVAPDFVDLGAGDLGGLTLAPGLYKWTTDVYASASFTLKGGVRDSWVFQIPFGTFNINNGVRVILAGGAQPANVFWQVIAASLGTTSHMEGIISSSTTIDMYTGATINGRLLAETAVRLQKNSIVQPKDCCVVL